MSDAPTIAICGICEQNHITTHYMANRYPNHSCKICDAYKEVKRAEQSVKDSVYSFEYHLADFKKTIERENEKLIKVLYK